MKVEIKEKNENPLLSRVEVKGSIEFEGATPSNMELIEILAKELKKDSNLIVVKNIYTQFSQQKAEFLAFVYNDQEVRSKTEKVTKHLKKKAEEAAKAAAEAKEAKEEEKPEEVKEAPAEEEKPAEEKTEEAPAAEEKPAEEVKKEEAKE